VLGLGALSASLAQSAGILRPPIIGDPNRPPPAPSTGTQLRYDYEYPLIPYGERPTHNSIARLENKLDRGEVKLKFVPERGYLDSVLQALNIDPSSQTLVFSKTSLQIELIKASTPRAIYFNDDTYIAWIPDTGILEITAMDSVLGPVFYTLANKDPYTTKLDRETSRCLTCHDTFAMMGGGVPHFLFLSSPVTLKGVPLTNEISQDTTDATPLRQRWGGWYVTGVPDGLAHMGNLQVDDLSQTADNVESLKVAGHTVEKLDGMFNTKPYLTNHSDVVALLVFEHQVYIENLITRASYKGRTMSARENDGQSTESLSWEQLPDKARHILQAMLEPLVKALVFVNATNLPNRIQGNSGFDRWFQAQGPRDSQGRSLRQLDLTTHVFRYPLSYMIYSTGFEGLPGYAKEYIYRRLGEVLSGKDQSAAYAHISAADRAVALQILTQTKPAFAAFAQSIHAQITPVSTLPAG
jgi:hypothetical protein